MSDVKDQRLFAGVDLGGTKIQTVVVRGTDVVGSDRVPTPASGADAVIAAIAGTVRTALDGEDSADLRGIGIGSPGAIDAARGVVKRSPNVRGFRHEVPLGPKVSEAFGGVPVTLENDVRVAMLGEHRRGAGRPFRDVLGVFVGTGVGGGLVLEGKLRDGRGAAGEIGHTSVTPNGRRCSCGRRGHLEAYAGRGCMEARARKLVHEGRKTDLFDIMREKGKPRLSSGVIAKALRSHDHVAESLIDDAVWALGIALSSAQNLLDLEAIIVGGGLGDRLGRPFVDRIADAMAPRLFVPERPPAVLPTELGDLSGAVGAAVLASRRVTTPGRPRRAPEPAG
ncbi:MAG TPA: ROK family protein [Actinomycetota bacterium]|jgi:glucokinase|nr:ROK family protein [Actinomycetota bacterium]